MALPITQPVTWFGPNDYPPEAMRASEEGAVRFALKVSANGAVTGCDIVESSGSSTLDTQTCALAMRRAKFEPAVDDRGNHIASTFTQRTRWVIPHPANEAADTPFGPILRRNECRIGRRAGAGRCDRQSCELRFQQRGQYNDQSLRRRAHWQNDCAAQLGQRAPGRRHRKRDSDGSRQTDGAPATPQY